MDKEAILSAIQNLACSQGFYGRLLRDITEDPSILDYLAEQRFTDVVDMVLFLEC